MLTLASDEGLIDAGLKIRTMRLPDIFQDQDKPEKQYDEAGLNAAEIVETVLKALRHNSAGVIEGARADETKGLVAKAGKRREPSARNWTARPALLAAGPPMDLRHRRCNRPQNYDRKAR